MNWHCCYRRNLNRWLLVHRSSWQPMAPASARCSRAACSPTAAVSGHYHDVLTQAMRISPTLLPLQEESEEVAVGPSQKLAMRGASFSEVLENCMRSNSSSASQSAQMAPTTELSQPFIPMSLQMSSGMSHMQATLMQCPPKIKLQDSDHFCKVVLQLASRISHRTLHSLVSSILAAAWHRQVQRECSCPLHAVPCTHYFCQALPALWLDWSVNANLSY